MAKPPVNLIYMKYFCDAVKLGSISASAKANFVSQSAISQAIAKLEKHFKKDLLIRERKQLKLTSEGEIVFERGKALLESGQELEGLLHENHLVKGVDFACTHSFALAILPKYLKKLRNKYPDLQVNFHLGHLGIIQELLKKGTIDCGIALVNEELKDFECIEIYRGEYQLYVSKKEKHPNNLPFLLSEERQETMHLKQAYKRKYKKPLPVLMEVQSWEVIAALTEHGLGIGYLPDYVVKERHQTLKVYDLGLPSYSYSVCAIFPKVSGKSSISRKVQLLLDIFEEKKT